MTAKLRVTILGCGSSGGVPRFGGDDGEGAWGDCDPTEPKNRRTRCSVLLERAEEGAFHPQTNTSVLIDTSPDMRSQLLAAKCARMDAVLYTHEHADQTHGIDDLRVLAISMRKRIPVYIDEATSGQLLRRFDYCFQQAPGSIYPAILEQKEMPPIGEKFNIQGPGGPMEVTAFLQDHGSVDSLGFRAGNIAYSSDVVDLPDESFELISGVDLWIVDALQYKPHKTHAHLEKTLSWIERVKPARAILTNMHVHMDYQTLRRELPAGVEPAYDGMAISIDDT